MYRMSDPFLKQLLFCAMCFVLQVKAMEHVRSAAMLEGPDALVLAAQKKCGAMEELTKQRSVTTETENEGPSPIVIEKSEPQEIPVNDSSPSESSSAENDEKLSVVFEVGKKGGPCHCKTEFRSKTVVKYVATAIAGVIAGRFAWPY